MKNTVQIKSTTLIKVRKSIPLAGLLFLTGVFGMAQNDGTHFNSSPYFLVLSENSSTDQLPLKSTVANVNIVGVIADVTIAQEYKNEGKNALEAIYTFPASSNSAVYALEMIIGDRKITAKIEEKDKARQEYTEAKEAGKRASLLEQERPNVFQMNVANIMPGDLIKVKLKYTELIVPEEGEYKFVYPTVVGPRYVGKDSPRTTFTNTPYQPAGNNPVYKFDIQVKIMAGMPVQNVNCKTHKVLTRFPKIDKAEIELDPTSAHGGDRDFILSYKLTGDKIQSGLLLYEHGDENFFLLMVQPPKRIIPEEIPPREYIFIIDVSGSMRGFPLTVTKTLMHDLVVSLRPVDKFNVMLFAGTSGWMSGESVPATIENIEKANHFIDSQQGGGGTELLPAMQKALAFPRASENLSRSFVVVTDGYVNVEKEVFDLIRENNDNANLFAFGIGSSVNRYIIEGMARMGMSEPLIVLNQENANTEAEKFRKYINSPVLTNVKKVFSGFEAYDIEPVSIPDVLAGRPVIIFGKYKGGPRGSITIKGDAGNNKTYKKVFEVSRIKPDNDNAAIRYLWARKRVEVLDDYNHVGYSTDNDNEVLQIGLKYNLLTAYTSFLAIEEDRVANNGTIETVKQALPMPQGVPNSAVGFEMEIEQIESSYSFHQSIRVDGNFSPLEKENIILLLEGDLIQQINLCLNSGFMSINSIVVEVNGKGIVIKSKITGGQISEFQKEEIRKIINSIDYSSFNSNTTLTFEIKY